MVAVVTRGNVDDGIARLTISNPPTQTEVQAPRDKCEQLADDVRNLSTLTCRPTYPSYPVGRRWKP
jgi:hypothetical protein